VDGGGPLAREPALLARAWSHKSDPGALLAAALLLRHHAQDSYRVDRSESNDALAQSVALLRRIEAALPATDALGGRARVELVFTLGWQSETEQASKALVELVASPLSWATVDAIVQIGQYQYQAGGFDSGYQAFALAASAAIDLRTRAAARAFAARIAVEDAQYEAAFGHISLLVNDPALVDALEPTRQGPFIATAARAVAQLPASAFDQVAAWPSDWAGTIASEASQYVYTSARLARLEAITTRSGHPKTSRSSPPDLDPSSALTTLVNDCVQDDNPPPLELTISVFKGGPPQVAVGGSSRFHTCLRQRAEQYFDTFMPGVRARVTVQPI